MNGPRASYQPDQTNPKRDDYSTHSSPSTPHPPLDATLFALRRHVKRRCNYAVCTYGVRTYARTDERIERRREQDGVSGGNRTACVSSVSFLSYPFRTPFSFFFLAPTPTCLPVKREREKKERERERADKPLRRAFSHPIVKGKGAITKRLLRRAVSVRWNRTPIKRERERERE